MRGCLKRPYAPPTTAAVLPRRAPYRPDGVIRGYTSPIEGTNKNWDHFVEVVKTDVKLSAGEHVLRLCQDTGSYDLDYIKVAARATP